MTKTTIICALLVLASTAVRGEEASVVATPKPQTTSPIACRLDCHQDQQQVWATVTFSNATKSTAPIFLGALLKIKELEGTPFKVSLDGIKVSYHGMLVNRAPPTPDEFLQLKPGEVSTGKVEISNYFDLSKPGNYIIQYSSISATPTGTNLIEIRSNPVRFVKKTD